jgi:hypothetical protein
VVVLASGWLPEARAIIEAYAPGAPIQVIQVGDAAGLRAALAGAQLGLFPQGDSWGAWTAAAQGLPIVSHDTAALTAMAVSAETLALREIARRSRQRRSGAP